MVSRSFASEHSLLHNLEINLLHVDLLTKLRRKLSRLHESRIYPGSHVGWFAMAILVSKT